MLMCPAGMLGALCCFPYTRNLELFPLHMQNLEHVEFLKLKSLKCISIGLQGFSPTLPQWCHQNLQSSIGLNFHCTTEGELICIIGQVTR